MKRCFPLITALVASLIVAVQASAQSSTGGSKIVRLSGSMTGMAVATSGGCTHGFSNQCPTGHICSCLTMMGAKFSSPKIGRGAANVFATVDQTASFGMGSCAPLYGEIDIIAKKDSPIFEMVGGDCFEPNGDEVLNGVIGLAASNIFKGTGAATYTATIQSSGLSSGGGRLMLSFKGTAE